MTGGKYLPLYVADYLADTQHLTPAQHGAYLLLIMHYWRVGALPKTNPGLARIAKMSPQQWAKNRAVLAEFFQPDWTHKRIDAELLSYAKKCTTAEPNTLKTKHSENTDSDSREPSLRSGSQEQSSLRSDSSAAGAADVSAPDQKTDQESDPKPEPDHPNGDLFGVVLVPKKFAERQAKLAALEAFGIGWNALAERLRLPQIDQIKPGSARERHAMLRLEELGKDYNSTPEEFFAKIARSPFLRGDTQAGFRATFDFVCTLDKFTKIMEGNYEAAKPKANGYIGSQGRSHH